MSVRPAQPSDVSELLTIWLRSVRATHTFLTERDIQSLLPMVRDQVLPNLNLWVLCGERDRLIGFMGVGEDSIEALFIDPKYLRRGGGTLLVRHARRLLRRQLRVDVNEQNWRAVEFYKASGFVVVGRSTVDDDGRPFPLLHMRKIGSVSW